VTATEPTTVEQIACMFRQMCDKLRDDCKTKNATVDPPHQEPLPLPPIEYRCQTQVTTQTKIVRPVINLLEPEFYI